MSVALVIKHAKYMRRIIVSCLAFVALQYFSTLSHKPYLTTLTEQALVVLPLFLQLHCTGQQEYSSLLGCYTVSTGKELPTFQKKRTSFIFRVVTLFGLRGHEHEGNKFIHSVGTIYQSIQSFTPEETSTSPLWKPQLSCYADVWSHATTSIRPN